RRCATHSPRSSGSARTSSCRASHGARGRRVRLRWEIASRSTLRARGGTCVGKQRRMQRPRILILWNQVDEDVVELWRRDGRRTPDWDPTKIVEPWDTVAEEIALIERSVGDGGYDVETFNIGDNFEAMLDKLEQARPDAILNLVEWYRDDLEH